LSNFVFAIPQLKPYAIARQLVNELSIARIRENVMGKGNHSQKNDKKSKKPKQDKSKNMKAK